MKKLLLVGLLAFSLIGCSGQVDETTLNNYEREVSSATYEGDWPFTDDSGVMGCIDSATYFDTGSNVYALSGFSRVYSDNKGLGWLPVLVESPFWLDDPDIDGVKVSVSNMISDALVLCGG